MRGRKSLTNRASHRQFVQMKCTQKPNRTTNNLPYLNCRVESNCRAFFILFGDATGSGRLAVFVRLKGICNLESEFLMP